MQPTTHELRSFEADVLARSHQRPVLVDFWAPWCGPCRVLGPILEKLAAEPGVGWDFVKVNTDEHPEISQRYGVRGIPNVKLFSGGEVVDEFTGALPEPAIRQWLDKALPSEAKRRFQSAELAFEGGDTQAARRLAEEVLGDEPQHVGARVLLARLLVFDDPVRATGLIGEAAFDGAQSVQLAEAVRTVADLRTRDPGTLPDGPAREAYRSALEALRGGQLDDLFAHLIAVLQTDRYYDDDGARRLGVAVFNLLGPTHPLTKKHRRTFDMWLY